MKMSPLHAWCCAATVALLALSTPAHAGPPLLCEPFDTGGAPSLPWGDGWNRPAAQYGLDRLVEDTQRLLAPDTPIIARMETLRRAAIYASRDGALLRDLAARLEARIPAAASRHARALALFDAGYFRETLQEVVRLQGYDMPGIGRVDARALRTQLADGDGSDLIAQALALRPQDAALQFAAAQVARADARGADAERHARLALDGADGDPLLARNVARLAD